MICRQFVTAVLVFAATTVVPTSYAAEDVPTQVARELFDSAGLWFSGRIAVWPIDETPELPSQPLLMLSDRVRAAIEQIGLKRGYKFVERQSIANAFREQQFSQGKTDTEFEQLAKQSGADAIAITSIHRKDDTAVIVSVRLVMVTGAKAGQVVAATEAHEFPLITSARMVTALWVLESCMVDTPNTPYCQRIFRAMNAPQ